MIILIMQFIADIKYHRMKILHNIIVVSYSFQSCYRNVQERTVDMIIDDEKILQ